MKARRLAETADPRSLSNRLRSRRFAQFDRLVAQPLLGAVGRMRILDIGGTAQFWEQRGWVGRDDVHIVALNLAETEQKHENIEPRVGDATDLGEWEDGSFDLVFSNSVIEHLETFEAQTAMAREVRRLSPSYWIQTPNFWFPVEPHFLLPGWQWLPEDLRVAILRRRRCGHRGPYPDPGQARKMVREIRLMKHREMRGLFPDASILSERLGPLVKSFVAHRIVLPADDALGAVTQTAGR